MRSSSTMRSESVQRRGAFVRWQSPEMEVLCVASLLAAGAALPGAPGELTRHLETFLQHTDYNLRRRHRPQYHISAPFGWLNDPAAFVHFQDKYHLFFQYFPYDGAWGPMHWGHVVSDDLVEWRHYPSSLVPREPYDRHGCLAGSAVVYNGFLTLFYTGETLVANRTRQTQNVAVSSDGILFQKYVYNPVVRAGPSTVDDIRNPKVWRVRSDWFMLVGASVDGQGHLMLYESPDLYKWRLRGTIARSHGDMGYLWESPELFDLDGQSVLVLSVRGAHPDGYRFRNLLQTGYVMGHFDYRAVRFEDLEISAATFAELDHGHDFYGAKAARAPDGRTLLVAWLGMWESEFRESREGWAGAMTLVREVHADPGGRLRTPPAREITALRSETLEDAWYSPGEAFYAGTRAFELVINASSTRYDVMVSLEWNGMRGFTVWYSSERRFVSVDRGGLDGERRAAWAPAGALHWRLFVDRTSAELYVGGGEVVFSSRIYPRRALAVRVGGDIQLHITQYRLSRALKFDAQLKTYLKEHILSKRTYD